jgi:hypothetical protein
MRDQRKLARHLAMPDLPAPGRLTGVRSRRRLPKRAADKLRSLLPIPI